MRYLDWDILLFPAASRTPMQEFKTACYAIVDAEPVHEEFPSRARPFRQTPICTCFVANRIDGTPFKVSVHSWEPPVFSDEVRSMVQLGKFPCFEVRIAIDGINVAGVLLHSNMTLPHVIEHSIQLDRQGRKDLLRWPVFHSEILRENYWSAGENIGRIKVTIAEGFVHTPGEGPFVRMNNIVTFAFQHAPQYILENAQVAWPNKGMWIAESQAGYNSMSPTKPRADMIDPDLHAHSPRRRSTFVPGSRQEYPAPVPMAMSFDRFMPPPPVPNQMQNAKQSIWGSQGLSQSDDPFIGRRGAARTADSDVSMHDYVGETSSIGGGLKTSGLGDDARNLTMMFDDSPDHPGPGAPTNTRASSLTNTPNYTVTSSYAPSASFHNFGMGMTQGVFAHKDNTEQQKPRGDHSPPEAATGENSRTPLQSVENDGETQQGSKYPDKITLQNLPKLPSLASPRSMSGGNKENSTSTLTRASSDGKRKRAGNSSISKKNSVSDLSGPSPRKVSRKEPSKVQQSSENTPLNKSDGQPHFPLPTLEPAV